MTSPAEGGRRDIAHVGSVELFSPTPAETVAFFRELMSLRVVHEVGASTYLHAWADYEAWTLKVTARADAGVGRTYLRAASSAALERVRSRTLDTGSGSATSGPSAPCR